MNGVIVEYVEGIEVIKAFNQSSSSYESSPRRLESFKDYTLKWYQSSWKVMNFVAAVLPSTFLGTLPIGMYLYWDGSLTPQDLAMGLILSLGIVGPLMNFTTYVNETKAIEYAVHDVDELLHAEELPDTGKPVEVPSGDHPTSGCFVLLRQRERQTGAFPYQSDDPGGKVHGACGPVRRRQVHHCSPDCPLLGCGRWKNHDWRRGHSGVCRWRSLPILSALSPRTTSCSTAPSRKISGWEIPDATDEEVYAAAKAACCDEFIQKLDNGYDTMAGDAGKPALRWRETAHLHCPHDFEK